MAVRAAGEERLPRHTVEDRSRSGWPGGGRRASLPLQLLGLILYCVFGILRLPGFLVAACRSDVLWQWVKVLADRAVGHAIVLSLGLIALWAAPFAAQLIPADAATDEHGYYTAFSVVRSGSVNSVYPEVIHRPTLLETTVIIRPPDDVLAYEVRGNDTLSDIAFRYGIDLDTLLWANDIAPDHFIQLGDQLRIPPIDGVIHRVREGDALPEIAELYQSNPVAIAEYNRIGLSTTLVAGMDLIIPYGVLPESLRKSGGATGLSQRDQPVAAFGEFRWPTQGVITQYFHSRHYGLDVGNYTGTAIVAADAGQVVIAGWSPIGYGNRIVINHGNGWVSTYNHLSTFSVSVGDFVKAGEVIGAMGNTGYSTGPHLHFELLYHNRFRDPLPLLN